jgi:hypothetical protein
MIIVDIHTDDPAKTLSSNPEIVSALAAIMDEKGSDSFAPAEFIPHFPTTPSRFSRLRRRANV